MALGVNLCVAVGYISPGGGVVALNRRHHEQDSGGTAALPGDRFYLCTQYLRDLIGSVSVVIVFVDWWDGTGVCSVGLAMGDQELIERRSADLKAAEGGD